MAQNTDATGHIVHPAGISAGEAGDRGARAYHETSFPSQGTGMIPDLTEARGSCHCGAVRFSVKLTDGLRTARRCNCSFCRMRGAVAVSADLDGIRIEQGKDALSEYRFNTGTAKHFFCSKCGIYTFHQRRSNPNQYGVNVACLEGLSPFDFEDVPVLDGAHHPKDGGGGVVGHLRYVPA